MALFDTPRLSSQSLKDSDGVSFTVAKQQDSMSCGPAAVYMMEAIAKDGAVPGGEARIQEISNRMPGSRLMSEIMSGTGLGDYGTFADNLKSVIQYIGLKISAVDSWNSVSNRRLSEVSKQLRPGRPALLLFGWYNARGRRGGGHFVCGARFNSKGALVILDPWGGEINEVPNHGTYKQTGRLDLAVYT